jgi:hypothetical protein
MPNDLFIQIAIWDRFGWGPRETDKLTLKQLRALFQALDAQRGKK